MLFNSFDFGLFLVVVYSLYWLIGTKRKKAQNGLILVASYFFYGLWDWRFLFLLLASTLIDYIGAQAIAKTSSKSWRKFYLWHNVFWNIGVLILFKYYDFFLHSFYQLWGGEYQQEGFDLINLVIPVGLSFYTFQTLSYTIDVYRGRIKPVTNLLDFMCFVSFFPQLVAGPIERASKLMPQISEQRKFEIAQQSDGLRRILWGLFVKVVIADSLGLAVDKIFADTGQFGGITLAYGAFLFAFQLYCDFSGYTQIAIGTAKLFGINLSPNFNHPYLAVSMTEFWRRWHMSLTRWFHDYVFKPLVRILGGSKAVRRGSSLMITMLLIGLWHGPRWTYVVFGLLHGIVLLAEAIKIKGDTIYSHLKKAPYVSYIYIWIILIISSIIFRSADITIALNYMERMFTLEPEPDGVYSLMVSLDRLKLFALFFVLEVLTRTKPHPMYKLQSLLPRIARWGVYYLFVYWILTYYITEEQFIYFQF